MRRFTHIYDRLYENYGPRAGGLCSKKIRTVSGAGMNPRIQ